jgi:hypothetical protein
MADSANTEPSKPSEPGFDGFDGSSAGQSAEIAAPASEPEARCAPFRLKPMISAVDSSTPTERVMSWAQWKADVLNQLFWELGNSGQPGRITSDTIRHGEQAWMARFKVRGIIPQKSPRSE